MAAERAMAPARRAVIVCRVSDPKQEYDGTSLDTQEDAARAFCEREGLEVVAAFRDTHSGFDLYREGLTQARTMLRAGEAEVLVGYALDRLSRNQVHQAVLINEADEHGYEILLVSERLDNTAHGRFLRSAIGFSSELEREKIIERTQRGLRQRVKEGKPLAGRFPAYGYLWADEAKSRLVEDADTAPVVRRMFQLVCEGLTLLRVAQILNAEGVPTAAVMRYRQGLTKAVPPRVPVWTPPVLFPIVTNPRYKGEARAYVRRNVTKRERDDLTRQVRKYKTTAKREQGETILLPPEVCPALVDAVTWQHAQTMLARNKKFAPRNNRDPKETLLRGGLVLCGYCRKPMRVRTRQDGGRAYYCRDNTYLGDIKYTICEGGNHSISAKGLDALVWGRVREAITREDGRLFRLALERRANVQAQDSENERATVASYDKTITDYHEQLEGLKANILSAKNVATITMLSGLHDEVAAKLAQALKQRDEAAAGLTDNAIQLAQLDELAAWAEAAASAVDDWDYEERRKVLHALGVRVEVFRAEHKEPDTGERFRLAFTLQAIAELFGGRVIGLTTACGTRYNTPTVEPLTWGEIAAVLQESEVCVSAYVAV